MVGTTLNHYLITKALGSGGMGEVFLADDLRLKRPVAIKILSQQFAGDAQRLERLQREAQAVAALNHPNIVTIHSVEQSGDVHFITMEFVEGRTLADLIPKDGIAMPLLLTIATQLVDAVIAAHGQGVIHRDLKPANVSVSAGNRVKVLDFGVAKLRDTTEDASVAPTQSITGEGTVVGTVAYMSPEQAEGKPVDERSDIFSLGVILYELATGRRPFVGDSNASVVSSILRDTPKSVHEMNPAVPPDLSRIVRRCLAKERDRRYQSARDLRNDLDDLTQSPTGATAPAPSAMSRRTHSAAVATSLVLGVAALVIAGIWFWPREDAAPVAPPPTMSHSRLTQEDGLEQHASLSSDGKWIVYVRTGDIFLQSTTGQTAINLTNSPDIDGQPAFSPDGDSIAFRSARDGGGIFIMGRTGESMRRLTKMGAQPAWFPDGRRIVFSTLLGGGTGPENRVGFSDLWIVDAAGGEPRRVFAGDAVQPRVSPNGKRIAFWALPSEPSTRRLTAPGVPSNRDIWTIAVDGTKPVRATTHDANDWDPVWAPDGRSLYFLSNRSGSMNLWTVGIDEESGVVHQEPRPITLPASYVADFMLSADGKVGAYTSLNATKNIARVPFDPVSARPTAPITNLTTGANEFPYYDVNRDGSLVVASTSERGQEDLYLISVAGGQPRQLTNDFARDRAPRWLPDGRQIMFYSDRRGYQLWRVDMDGSGLTEVTHSADTNLQHPAPSRDGSRLAVVDAATRRVFIYSSNDFSKPVEQLPEFPENTATPQVKDWSPNGRLLAIFPVSGSSGLWTYSFDTSSYRRHVTATLIGVATFVDDRRILYPVNRALSVLDVTTGVSTEVLRLEGEDVANPRLTADRSQLFFTRAITSGDIWLVRFGQ